MKLAEIVVDAIKLADEVLGKEYEEINVIGVIQNASRFTLDLMKLAFLFTSKGITAEDIHDAASFYYSMAKTVVEFAASSCL